MVMHSGLLREGAKVRPGIVKAKSGSKVSFDLRPEQDPFPHFQFATPARYHSPTQNFAIGDLVWYEIQGNFNISSKGIQWGEATIVEVYGEEQSARYYRLAGKSWSYDHFVHPLIGDSDGPPAFRNLSIDASRAMIKQWTISNHDNSYVRGMAMQNKDQVLHPALSRVPRTALFKVWDRSTMPPIPFPLSALTVDGKNPSSRQRQATYTLQDAQSKYGTDLQFKGSKQNNYGPGHWGITMEQLRAVQEMDGFESSMTMYDVVSKLLKPMTKGSGMGYALYLNKEKPLVAKQMVSHAWGEQYTHFVQALEGSRCEGPFWICATAIDQENSERIADQLGPSLEHGPFATVLKQVTDMICVFTPAVDIYLRMWCVFEIYVAVKYGVNVVFAAWNQQVRSGIENIYDAIYEHGKSPCYSEEAKCGNKSDESQIRKLIHDTQGGFDGLDSVVEWCKANYYIGEVHHPGIAFQSEAAHLLLLGGSGKLDYLARTLSSVVLSSDRIQSSWKEQKPTICCNIFKSLLKN